MRFLSCIILLIGTCFQLRATHLASVELTYSHITGNYYEINLVIHRDCDGIEILDIPTIFIEGCGVTDTVILSQKENAEIVSPSCPSQNLNNTCNGGTLPGIERYVYSTIYRFDTTCTNWIFSYTDGGRNVMITNITDGTMNGIYIEAKLDNSSVPKNNSPEFLTSPVVYVCEGLPFRYNPGGYDQDGDSLHYSLISALEADSTPIPYTAGLSPTYPLHDTRGYVDFDSSNGELGFEPQAGQVIVLVFKVEEYRDGQLIGYTLRDMQVILQNCSNQQSTNMSSGITNAFGGTQLDQNSMAVCPGDSIYFETVIADANSGDTLSAISNINTTIPDANLSFSGTNPITATFSWVPGKEDIGLNVFTITASDNSCPISLKQVYTFDIDVQGVKLNAEQPYCRDGKTFAMDVKGQAPFTWSSIVGDSLIVGSNFSCNPCRNPVPSPTQTTTYVVQNNNTYGCPGSDTVVVFVPDSIGYKISITPNLDSLCYGETVTLSHTSSNIIKWFEWVNYDKDFISFNDTINIVVDSSTTYFLKVTDTNGCTSTDTAATFFISNHGQQLHITQDTSICKGKTVQLSAFVNHARNASCSNYRFTTTSFDPPIAGGWISPTFNNLSKGKGSGPVPLPFTFDYFCESYDTIYICTNGWATFDKNVDFSNPILPPFTLDPLNSIYLAADISLNIADGGAIYYKTIGSMGNRTFIIRFDSVSTGTGYWRYLTGEIHLNESDQSIELHIEYRQSLSSGLTGIVSSDGLRQYFTTITLPSLTNYSYRFAREDSLEVPNLIYNWSPVTGLNSSNAKKPIATVDSTITYTVTVNDAYSICPSLVDSVILGAYSLPSPTLVYDDSLTFCEGDGNVFFETNVPYLQYKWSNGNTQGGIAVNDSATIFVLVTDSNGCKGYSDTLNTVAYPLPDPPIISLVDTLLLSDSTYWSYQWLWDGDTIIGATDSLHAPTETGSYSLVVTNNYGCVAVSDTIYFELPDHIFNGRAVRLKVFPNPAHDYIILALTEGFLGKAPLTIYNAIGEQVYSGQLHGGSSKIDVHDWQSGIYIANILNPKNVNIILQFVIKN